MPGPSSSGHLQPPARDWPLRWTTMKRTSSASARRFSPHSRELAADSARRLEATGHPVPADFAEAIVRGVLSALPTPGGAPRQPVASLSGWRYATGLGAVGRAAARRGRATAHRSARRRSAVRPAAESGGRAPGSGAALVGAATAPPDSGGRRAGARTRSSNQRAAPSAETPGSSRAAAGSAQSAGGGRSAIARRRVRGRVCAARLTPEEPGFARILRPQGS